MMNPIAQEREVTNFCNEKISILPGNSFDPRIIIKLALKLSHDPHMHAIMKHSGKLCT